MEKFFKYAMMTFGFLIALSLTMLFGKTVVNEYGGKPETYCDYTVPSPQAMVFTSVDAVISAHQEIWSDCADHDTFLSIPPKIVEQLATEILSKQHTCTIKDISSLFRERYRIDNFTVNEQMLDDKPTPENTGVPLCPTQQISDTSTTVTNANTQ